MGSGNIKKFELKLGRNGIIIVILGMAVLLCLTFILGVEVGKNMDTYPEKISSTPQQILAFFWRPAKVADQQKNAAGKEPVPVKGNMDLAFHNNLTGQKTQPMQPPLSVEKNPDSAVVTDQNVKQQPSPIETPKEEVVPPKKEVAEKQVAVSKKEPVETKSKIKEILDADLSTKSSFLIHVASMKDREKANQIAKAVASMGYPSKVSKADIKGKGIFYRVMTTGFETKAKAQAAADKISKKVKTNCIIRPASGDTGKNQ